MGLPGWRRRICRDAHNERLGEAPPFAEKPGAGNEEEEEEEEEEDNLRSKLHPGGQGSHPIPGDRSRG